MFDPIYSIELPLIEWNVYNKGERLVPIFSHDIGELIRHESAYAFFKKVIELDLKKEAISKKIKITDLGCGVGYGCCILADLPNVEIIGIDNSQDALDYANAHYARPNITYENKDLSTYISSMPTFDYIIVSHVLEHLPNGLQLTKLLKWNNRLLFNVPYNEVAKINNHHVISHINEDTLLEFSPIELFFQDLSGAVYNVETKPIKPLSMSCVCSQESLICVGDYINFPVPAWKFGQLNERINLEIEIKENLIENAKKEILKLHAKIKITNFDTFIKEELGEKLANKTKLIENETEKINGFKKLIREITR